MGQKPNCTVVSGKELTTPTNKWHNVPISPTLRTQTTELTPSDLYSCRQVPYSLFSLAVLFLRKQQVPVHHPQHLPFSIKLVPIRLLFTVPLKLLLKTTREIQVAKSKGPLGNHYLFISTI